MSFHVLGSHHTVSTEQLGIQHEKIIKIIFRRKCQPRVNYMNFRRVIRYTTTLLTYNISWISTKFKTL